MTIDCTIHRFIQQCPGCSDAPVGRFADGFQSAEFGYPKGQFPASIVCKSFGCGNGEEIVSIQFSPYRMPSTICDAKDAKFSTGRQWQTIYEKHLIEK